MIIETKETGLQLYNFILKMMRYVTEALDDAEHTKDLDNYRSITQIFERLVSLIIQLNKLSKDEQWHIQEILPAEDIAIIERFMVKYEKKI